MKTLLLVTLVALAGFVRGQDLKPAYLSKFPSVERIEKEVKGSSPIDTYARRAGAYWQLSGLISQMAWVDHRDRNHLTPDETKTKNLYLQSYSHIIQTVDAQLSPEPQNAWYKLHTDYQDSHELRDEIFQRFFDDDFRAQVYKALGEPVPARTIPAPKSGAETADAYVAQGMEYRADGDRLAASKPEEAKKEYEAAAAAYKKAIELDAHSYDGRLGLALTYMNGLQMEEQALEVFKQLRAMKPDDDTVTDLTGITQYKLDRMDDAMATFKLAAKPGSKEVTAAVAHHWMGKILSDRKKYAEAVPEFQETLKIVKEDAQTSDDLGFAYYSLRRYSEAIASYKEAIRLSPSSGKTYGELVMAYVAVGDKTSAADTLAKLKTVDPELYRQFVKGSGGG
ncbi:MAG TPA: tetratricopeptide repeat protein [Fimbriimonadaceae bacterium]|nr:tetratricopeptide repeat protein [Fimbriimonadaceae bacterium]